MHNFLGGDTPPAPRSHPLLAFSPKYSALICSRTNLPRSRKARLPAPGSAQSSLGTVVSSLPTDQREHPENSVGGRPLPHSGLAARVSSDPSREISLGGASHGRTRGPRGGGDYISQDVARGVSFRARSRDP